MRRTWRWLALLAGLTAGGAWAVERDIPSYEKMQTFKGQAFFADENTWIYTAAFAERYGLPKQWVSSKLVGIEAAAFRIVPGELQCGLTRKREVCRRTTNCLTDVYIDENKYPLPWATDESADWRPIGDSFGWLYDPKTGAPGQNRPPAGIPDSGVWTLHPWVDKKLKLPVQFTQNIDTPDPNHWGNALTFAYKRHLPGNLTMVTLGYRCMSRNKRPYTTFILAPENDGHVISAKRFHEFRLPDEFEQRIDERLADKAKGDEVQYKKLLGIQ
ncbi:MAG: hypothetical protein PHU46_09460 [Rhodocyclaceae bacterium]|nr:hypothetical protein [Rhodocyclaceae bacterium]